jgi:hypothetical protein
MAMKSEDTLRGLLVEWGFLLHRRDKAGAVFGETHDETSRAAYLAAAATAKEKFEEVERACRRAARDLARKCRRNGWDG